MDGEAERIFASGTNRLSFSDFDLIMDFLEGRINKHPSHPTRIVQRITLHEVTHQDSQGKMLVQRIIFEMNFLTRHWRKLRRSCTRSATECNDVDLQCFDIPRGWDANGNRSLSPSNEILPDR